MIARNDAILGDDQHVVELIRSEVERRTNGAIRNLVVSIHDDSIVLSGIANRYYGKQLATSAVLEEFSFENFKLCNEIVVTAPAELEASI